MHTWQPPESWQVAAQKSRYFGLISLLHVRWEFSVFARGLSGVLVVELLDRSSWNRGEQHFLLFSVLKWHGPAVFKLNNQQTNRYFARISFPFIAVPTSIVLPPLFIKTVTLFPLSFFWEMRCFYLSLLFVSPELMWNNVITSCIISSTTFSSPNTDAHNRELKKFPKTNLHFESMPCHEMPKMFFFSFWFTNQ